MQKKLKIQENLLSSKTRPSNEWFRWCWLCLSCWRCAGMLAEYEDRKHVPRGNTVPQNPETWSTLHCQISDQWNRKQSTLHTNSLNLCYACAPIYCCNCWIYTIPLQNNMQTIQAQLMYLRTVPRSHAFVFPYAHTSQLSTTNRFNVVKTVATRYSTGKRRLWGVNIGTGMLRVAMQKN